MFNFKFNFRQPVSGLTHLVAAILSILGTIWLATLAWGDTPRLIVVLVFGVSLTAIYIASSALHLFDGHETWSQRLRRCDHASIYLGIAGGYTPFVYHALNGNLRWIALGLIWGLALTGALSKLVFFFDGHFSTALYILMGWVGMIFAPEGMAAMATSTLLLVAAGGVIYTIGAIIYALERPNFHVHFGHHEVWHVFVMTGSAIHFAAVLLYIA
jgi:hemolysin III